MKITEEVRAMAEKGLAEKATEFKEAGSTLYTGRDDHHH
jgi:hypothetical protein